MEYSHIEFDYAGNGEVVARVTLCSDDADQLTVEFRHRAGESNYGEALSNHLCKVLTHQLQAAKKGAYDLGFHEGRNTRRKGPRPLRDFWGDLDPQGR